MQLKASHRRIADFGRPLFRRYSTNCFDLFWKRTPHLKLSQFVKTSSPINVTLDGILICFRRVHDSNARLPMLTTLLSTKTTNSI